jgi:hypothetical protein
LDDATKIVNFIKQRTVQSTIFKLCDNLDEQHADLLLHIETRRLKRKIILNGVIVLKREFQGYFHQNSRSDFANCFEDEQWLEKLAYFSRHFSSHEPDEQVSVKLWRKYFDFK